MTEQIGKVTLDYTFYNGQDQYSDGDIENDLLQLIMEEPDVEKILAEDDRWPVLYHFSPVRQNILEWYPFKKDASVLEIGAGCGAISGVLCRNAKHVTSVDLSKRRSLINANRNKEYDNLTIMVGNFNDVVLKEKYDYFVVGSDQVWHCMHGEKKELEFFFLKFASPWQRITMAPSFGFKKIPYRWNSIYTSGLRGFRYLSCRENEGAVLIERQTGQQATVLLDPTMLIEDDVWWKIQKMPLLFLDEEYILVYALGDLDKDTSEYIREIGVRYNYSIVYINDVKSPFYTKTRPDEFLYWISHSKLVVTDSFHAIVFSIIFRKAFLAVNRSDGKNMQDRIDTLLTKFMLMERKYPRIDHSRDSIYDSSFLFETDYTITKCILKEEREKAAIFFRQNFKSNHRIKMKSSRAD